MRDPFKERFNVAGRRRVQVLGARFEFVSNHRSLLRLVDEAYAGLPPHRFDASDRPFRIDLRLTPAPRVRGATEPPDLAMQAGGGVIFAGMDAGTFAIVNAPLRAALVAISSDVLRRFPYHARYEVLEFVVFTLASRGQGLMPLHAGCVSAGKAGLLLVGESGAGKSTLALQCLRHGLDLVSEDAVFVAPDSLRATGVANFLHLRPDALPLIADRATVARIRRSPTIRRRSGVKKFEIDVRQGLGTNVRSGQTGLARAPVSLVGAIFVSKKRAQGAQVLAPLSQKETLRRLRASQDYAAALPGWSQFGRGMARLGGFELRRAHDVAEGAKALKGLLEWGRHKR